LENGKSVKNVSDKGTLIYIYASDPEGNIIELQTWELKG
jgi:catechol-2,3-dioxygenase